MRQYGAAKPCARALTPTRPPRICGSSSKHGRLRARARDRLISERPVQRRDIRLMDTTSTYGLQTKGTSTVCRLPNNWAASLNIQSASAQLNGARCISPPNVSGHQEDRVHLARDGRHSCEKNSQVGVGLFKEMNDIGLGSNVP